MTVEIEEYLYALPDSALLDILRIILIRLGQRGLATVEELVLLVSVEDWQDLRARRVA